MEKIMARFTNFNQILSRSSNNDDDDDDDDEDTKEEDNFDEDDEDKPAHSALSHDSDRGIKIEPVVIPEKSELVEEYSDSSYWKM